MPSEGNYLDFDRPFADENREIAPLIARIIDKVSIFLKNFPGIIWLELKKCVPLHPLSERGAYLESSMND